LLKIALVLRKVPAHKSAITKRATARSFQRFQWSEPLLFPDPFRTPVAPVFGAAGPTLIEFNLQFAKALAIFFTELRLCAYSRPSS
jgi:hypothetical protein